MKKGENNNMIVELNNIKYLAVEIIVNRDNEKKIRKLMKKYECIYQGVVKIDRGGFFSSALGVFRILVPENNILKFNNEDT